MFIYDILKYLNICLNSTSAFLIIVKTKKEIRNQSISLAVNGKVSRQFFSNFCVLSRKKIPYTINQLILRILRFNHRILKSWQEAINRVAIYTPPRNRINKKEKKYLITRALKRIAFTREAVGKRISNFIESINRASNVFSALLSFVYTWRMDAIFAPCFLTPWYGTNDTNHVIVTAD